MHSCCWGPPPFRRVCDRHCAVGYESFLSNEITKEKNNPTKIYQCSAKALPLPLDLAVARREACNGSHKLREEQYAGRAGGGCGAARGMQWREEQCANLEDGEVEW